MDVSLVPAMSASAPAAPAQTDARGVSPGAAPFGAALASALGDPSAARNTDGARDPRASFATGAGRTVQGGGAPPDEPANAASGEDNLTAGAAAALIALFGVPAPVPFEPPPAPQEPTPDPAKDIDWLVPNAGDAVGIGPAGVALEVVPAPAEAGTPGGLSLDAATSVAPADGDDEEPTLAAPQPEAKGMAAWFRARTSGQPAILPSQTRQTPSATDTTSRSAVDAPANRFGGHLVGDAADVPVDAGQRGAGLQESWGGRAPEPASSRPGIETGGERRAPVSPRAVAPSVAAVPVGVAEILKPEAQAGSATVQQDGVPAATRADRADLAAVASAVQAAVDDTDTILAFPEGDAVAADAAADTDALARVAAGSASEDAGSRNRSRDDEAPAERGPVRHVAATAVAAYASVPGPVASDPLARALAAAPVAGQVEDTTNPTVDGEPLPHAIVKSLKLQWSQGAGEARLQLKPEYLGELSVSLKVQGSTVTAVLQSDSAAVRTWVEEHQGELRRALEDIGLSLDRLVIDADGESNRQQQSAPEERRQPQARRQVPAGRFEALL